MSAQRWLNDEKVSCPTHLLLNFDGLAEGIKTDDVIDELVGKLKVMLDVCYSITVNSI